MVLTTEEANRHILSTISKDGFPEEGAMRILNNAGNYLANCHPWTWLVGRETKLSFEESQAYVWLPRNFRDIVGIDTTQGLTSGLNLTTMQHLIELRTSAITNTTWVSFAALAWESRAERATGTVVFTAAPSATGTVTINDGVNAAEVFEFVSADGAGGTGNVEVNVNGLTAVQSADALQDAITAARRTSPLDIDAVVDATLTGTVNLTNRRFGTSGNIDITDSASGLTVTGMSSGQEGSTPEARLELWPTPTAALENAVTLYYRAGWLPLHEDDDQVNIPEWLESVYLALVRAYARGYQEEDLEPMEARIGRVLLGPDMQAAIQRDSSAQGDYGMLRGGAMASSVGYAQHWNFTGVSAPS